MSIDTNILASPLEGRHLVQEIKPDTTNPKVRHLLVQELLPGSFNYRGLVLKYHRVVDPETGKNLGATLPEGLPTRPVTMQTANVVERLTGLCIQQGYLTLERLDRIIRSGGFYHQPIEQVQPFIPSPELEESLSLLLQMETIADHKERVRQLASLNDEHWKRYAILHKARNKALVELLGTLPGLLSDASMRTWFIVTLNTRMQQWMVEAQAHRSQSFLYSHLNKA